MHPVLVAAVSLMKSFAIVLLSCLSATSVAVEASFAEFDRRAQSGESLNVVFFGASLTWGANASDPQLTSYRGQTAERLLKKYPRARFRFWDAAIGGTSSQLGIFRLDRDVLARNPDLVFVDFSANDGLSVATPETLASYEAIIRRLVEEAKVPVVQVVFPFQWDVARGHLDGLLRRDAHHRIAQAYHTAIGDAVELAQQRVKTGATTIPMLWPYDGVHPGDEGYSLFADAAWAAFENAITDQRVCQSPARMLHASTYMHTARVRISSLGNLPVGWNGGRPNVVSAYFDMLMSRWLDDETIVANHGKISVGRGEPEQVAAAIEPLTVCFRGNSVLVFGESTKSSGKFRAIVDGRLVERKDHAGKAMPPEFDASHLSRIVGGNTHFYAPIIEGLDGSNEHTLVIEPVFDSRERQELRLESICVAGEGACVALKSSGK